MRYGFVVPFATEHEFIELARLGEDRGWHGVFTWEALYGIDAWVLLGATAAVTDTIQLGTLLTPAARHRPWDLASDVGTVDRISAGRAILSVGLGALHPGWTAFEPDEGRAVRVKRLDECLDIYAGLLGGEELTYAGEYYQARPYDFPKPPLTPQRPHPPVWVVGARTPGRQRQPSLERAARWQGLIPAIHPPDDRPKTLEAFRALVDPVRSIRRDLGLPWEGYDVVIEADSWGSFTRLEPAEPAAWQDAGATWWIESWWDVPEGKDGVAELRRRIGSGPPGR